MGRQNQTSAVELEVASKESPTQKAVNGLPAGRSTRLIILSAALIFSVLFLLFFHIVPEALTVFPKQYPTFADTVVEVDTIVKNYNESKLIDKKTIRESYLFQKLREKKLIREKE